MKFELNKPIDITSDQDKNEYARDIVALANNENFDEMQKDPIFSDIFDSAIRYLDKELENEKEANWRKLEKLTKNL